MKSTYYTYLIKIKNKSLIFYFERIEGDSQFAISAVSVKTAGDATDGERIEPPSAIGESTSGDKTTGLNINGLNKYGFNIFGDKTYGVS